MGEIDNPYPLGKGIEEILRVLGLDAPDVAEIIIKPGEVQIRRYKFDQDGRKIEDHLGQPKTYVDLVYWHW